MVHQADHGSLPADNAKNPPPIWAAQPGMTRFSLMLLPRQGERSVRGLRTIFDAPSPSLSLTGRGTRGDQLTEDSHMDFEPTPNSRC